MHTGVDVLCGACTQCQLGSMYAILAKDGQGHQSTQLPFRTSERGASSLTPEQACQQLLQGLQCQDVKDITGLFEPLHKLNVTQADARLGEQAPSLPLSTQIRSVAQISARRCCTCSKPVPDCITWQADALACKCGVSAPTPQVAECTAGGCNLLSCGMPQGPGSRVLGKQLVAPHVMAPSLGSTLWRAAGGAVPQSTVGKAVTVW